ncbi:hypothetical protein BS47DRAFT_1308903 [Hydnum rufescens UP504]|uniref:Uncharacterized protein n=1 Tax=Hydnum rufescens UP504 TaxID=1448309 RepID=A0A9P6ADS1_9AGAM|nr:hypothetical protein BS47DRAFT_1308903 [Hydnum rufescens UP504]
MRGKNGIPSGPYVPQEIESEGLLKMDVDQPLWEDVYIADFPDGKVPDWLEDESLCTGITAAQEAINCKQDLLRCCMEHSNLHAWYKSEFTATKRACDLSSGVLVLFTMV